MRDIEYGTITYLNPLKGSAHGYIKPDENPPQNGGVKFFVCDGRKVVKNGNGAHHLTGERGEHRVGKGMRVAFVRVERPNGPKAHRWGLVPQEPAGTDPAAPGGDMPQA